MDGAFTTDIDALYEEFLTDIGQFVRRREGLRETFTTYLEQQRTIFGKPIDDEIVNRIRGSACVYSYIPSDVIREGDAFLDVGFGEGRTLLALADTLKMRPFGVDKYSFKTAARIESALKDRGASVVTPLDVETERLPFDDGSFAFIICQQVIEHLHNSPKLMLDEIARVLKPGGALIMDTPNHAYWGNRLALLKGESVHWDLGKFYRYEWSSDPHPGVYFGHTREFTPDELSEMARWAGLDVEVSESVTYCPVLAGRELQDHFVQMAVNEFSTTFGVELEIKARSDAPLQHLLATCMLVARKPR